MKYWIAKEKRRGKLPQKKMLCVGCGELVELRNKNYRSSLNFRDIKNLKCIYVKVELHYLNSRFLVNIRGKLPAKNASWRALGRGSCG